MYKGTTPSGANKYRTDTGKLLECSPSVSAHTRRAELRCNTANLKGLNTKRCRVINLCSTSAEQHDTNQMVAGTTRRGYGANGPGIRVSTIETEIRKLGFAYGRIATV